MPRFHFKIRPDIGSYLVVAFCVICLPGCQDNPSSESAPSPINGAQPAQRPITSPAKKPAANAAANHQSPIRFKALSVDEFPAVIPDNGARHGYATILESLGSGGAAVDVDRDGWPDAIIAGGGNFSGRRCVGRPVYVLRNRQTHFENATSSSGVEMTRHYHHGICAADFDHDGFEDFLVAGYGGMQLFCNRGDGTFAASTDANDLVPGGWSASAAWGDFNRDNHLDLYISGYVNWSFENDPPCFAADGTTRDNCSPKMFEPIPDSLLLSDGRGSFIDRSSEFKIRPDGKTLGVVAADLNADGLLDLYVGNDVMMNFLYQNKDGTALTDWSMNSGAAGSRRGSPDASMGVDVVDFDNDGFFDIWAANFELESFALYKNLGQLQFRHVSETTGVTAIGGHYVGWGTAFVDLDLDGDSDTVVCNGNVVQHPTHSPTLQRMILLENVEGRFFEEVTAQAGDDLMRPRHGRGLAWTDWNRDGKVDLLVTPTHSPAQLLENRTNARGQSLTVQLVGTHSPRQPIGTVVELVTSQNKQQKQLIGGGSYASTSLAELHFGIPQGSVALEVRTHWPDGNEMVIPVTAEDRRIVAIQGRHPAPQTAANR